MNRTAPVAAFLFVTATHASAQDEVDLGEVERRVVDQLATTDVTALAESVASAMATADSKELLFRLEVFVRAGHDVKVGAALDALAQMRPRLRPAVAAALIDSLIDRKDRALAVAAFERFPEAPAGWGYVLMKDWAADAGWTTVDAWAALRQPAAPEYWLGERLRLRSEHGEAQPLFDELVADAKAQPADLDRFLRVITLRHHLSPSPDLEWMAKAFEPRLAFDAARLGQALQGRPAVELLERALAMPMTERDVAAAREFARTRTSLPMFHDDDTHWRAWLRDSIRYSLLVAYRAAGDVDRAQELMVALADEHPGEHGLPGISLLLAGDIQAASGARVIESRIRHAETTEHDSAEYWKGRADYFRGRGEDKQALDALDRALALTPFESSAAGRYFLIFDRARLLPKADAAAFLRDELRRMPADSEYAGHTLMQIVSDWPDGLTADDPLAWRHLETVREWYVNEERLLMLLAEKAGPAKLAGFWERAEMLAQRGPDARAATLGEVARRRGEFARAVALLAPVLERMPADSTRDRAALTLLQASEELCDWRRAESTWPLARRRLTPREQVRWLGELALRMAKAGAFDDSLRTWVRAANLDRRELSLLQAMIDAGMRERLETFYAGIARRDPEAEPFVRRVLEALRAH